MIRNALGLIETNGLIGAIAATDAAAKAAAVVISSAEVTDAAYLTLRIEGELSAVQAAVDAGSRAAQLVGDLVGTTVIPRPDPNIDAILPDLRYNSKFRPDKRGSLSRTDTDPELSYTAGDSVTRPGTFEELESMTVTELRQLARTLPDFPLKGREISMAARGQLIDALRTSLGL